MGKRIEYQLTGSGGQGLITAGIILAEAAILDGNNAIQSQSYGPEARGGASKAEVVISKDVIDYPKTISPDYILCLTDEAYEKYGKENHKNGIIMVDQSVSIEDNSNGVIKAPILSTASEQLKPIVANIIALGFIASYSNVVTKDSLLRALMDRVPKGTEEMNQKALDLGYQLAEDALNAK